MTTIAPMRRRKPLTDEAKAALRQYHIERRPIYAARKAELRKGWKETERAALKRRATDPAVWAGYMISRTKHRAKKRGIEFGITAADLVLPDKCPVLGIPLVVGLGQGFRANPASPSVDRFDNNLGYVPGNVRIISYRANVLKNDATLEEMRAVLRYMEDVAR